MWDLVPQPGIEPRPPALGGQSLSHWTTREVPQKIFVEWVDKKWIRSESQLPWWLSGKGSTCQCRRHRSNSWSGMIPHATEQLSLSAALLSPRSGAQELQRLSPHAREPVLCNRRSPHSALESSPCSLQLQKKLHSNKDLEQPKMNTKNYIFFKKGSKEGRKRN